MFRSRARRSRLLPLGLGLFLAATLVACGGSESDANDPADSSADSPADTATNTPTESATNTPAESTAGGGAEEAANTYTPPPTVSAAERDAVLGDPLVVNGETISIDEIRRCVIFMSTGRGLYELAKVQVYIDQEIQRQIEQEGKTMEDFAVSQVELDGAIKSAHETVEQQYEGQEGVTLDDFYPTKDPAWVGQVKQTKLFKRVFLPENPHEYPPITSDAFNKGEDGERILQVLKEDWDRKQLENESADPSAAPAPDAGQRVFEMMLTQQVLAHLAATAVIKEIEDGIPAHLLGIANGVEIPVEGIWSQVWHTISPQEVWKAKQWLAMTTLLRQALEESGFLMSREEAAAIWEEQAAPYRDSFFSYEKMALTIKKFPTLGNYLTYHRLYESYQRQIAEEMTDEALEKQGRDRTAAIVSLTTADVDIILLSAYDFKGKKWIEDGWDKAAARAKEVSEKLVAGEDWNTLLDEYSEFYDPPIPTAQQDNADYLQQQFNKGRMRGWVRNRLMTKLEEPEFLLFLNGTSITDIIFFEQEIGSIENPIRGPHGYYIPRLLHRGAPTMSLSANDSKSRPYLEQDYVAMRLRNYSQELLAKAEITGL